MSNDADPMLGRLLYAVRPTPRLLPIAVGVAVLLALDAFIFFRNDHSWAGVLFGTLGGGGVMLLAAGSGLLEQHRVYEHAIVVGLTWPRSSTPYVVPIATIDPATVTVHYRANLIARRLKTQGSPTMRMAVYSTRAVSFAGRSWETSSAALDPESPAAKPRRRRLLELRQQAFSGAPLPGGATSLWALGVRSPEPLLRAMEGAFAADGRPQPGLADRALRHPIVEPSGRPVHPATGGDEDGGLRSLD